MKKSVFLIIISFFAFSFHLMDKKKTIEIPLDGYGNTIQLEKNEAGLPLYYWSSIFTPICNTSECLPVKINLFWDLDGNYWKYEMPDKEILTKTEHAPFTAREYVLLDLMLADSFSLLKNYTVDKLEELYSASHEADSNEVDGITGATNLMPEGSYIPGALFTSVRLWHLANDKTDLMRGYTASKLVSSFSSELLSTLNKEQGSLIALLDYKRNSDIKAFAAKLGNAENSLVARTLPVLSLADIEAMQNTLFKLFTTRDEEIRAVVNTIWQNELCSDGTILKLLDYVNEDPTVFPYLNDLLMNRVSWSPNLQHAVLTYIQVNNNLNRKQKLKNLFNARNSEYTKSVKKRIKKETY